MPAAVLSSAASTWFWSTLTSCATPERRWSLPEFLYMVSEAWIWSESTLSMSPLAAKTGTAATSISASIAAITISFFIFRLLATHGLPQVSTNRVLPAAFTSLPEGDVPFSRGVT